MPDFGIFRGFGEKLTQGQTPTQLGLIGSRDSNLLILDTYTNAAAAYSLRQLLTLYTGACVRVRRSSDNTELDINFVNNIIDSSTLISFCGSGNGFVTTWYDQSGNARNATQTTAANQPKIVSNGSMINVNSKPSLQFDGSNDRFVWTYQWANQTFDSFNVTQNLTSAYKVIIAEGNSGSAFTALGSKETNQYYLGRTLNQAYPFTSLATLNTQILSNFYSLLGLVAGTISVQFRKNNGSEESVTGSVTNTNNQSSIGSGGLGDYYNGQMQEVILYSADKTVDRTGIATNINSYYGIY